MLLKIRKLGLGAGLALGGILMLAGYLMMSLTSSGGGGGIMIVLGLLLILPGAFITVSTLAAWLLSKIYGSLSDGNKRRVKYSFLILFLGSIAWFGISTFLFSRPAAISARQEVWAEQARLDQLAASGKIEAAQRFLIGAWRNETQPENIDVFNDQGVSYSITNGKINHLGQWSLDIYPHAAPAAVELTRNFDTGYVVHRILTVDDSQLVIELLTDADDSPGVRSAAIHTYGRVIDTEALPKFDPAAVTGKKQPEPAAYDPFAAIATIPVSRQSEIAETKIIEGVTHRLFASPIAVTTGGGIVRSGPGLTHSKASSLYKGDPVALVAVTDVNMDGYLWFQIRYRDGQQGYALGALLCARETWLEGLHKQCPVFFYQ
jgi:hypothetical protein